MPFDRKALEAMDDAQLDALEQELTGKVMRSRQKPGWGEKEWWKQQPSPAEKQEQEKKDIEHLRAEDERKEGQEWLEDLTEAEKERFEIYPKTIDPDTGKVTRDIREKQEYKETGASEKRGVEAEQLSSELQGLFKSFSQARKEAGSLPIIGEQIGTPGLGGRIAGKAAGLVGNFGLAPATNVYNKKRKAFATVVAKAAGEVRPTDVDIQRFLGTLMNPDMSDAENELIMQDLLTKVDENGVEPLVGLWNQATGKDIGESVPESARLGDKRAEEMADLDAQIAEVKARIAAKKGQ